MDKLARESQQLFGLKLTPSQLEALGRYRELLLEWNQIHNLTAIREAEEVRAKHFLDSLSCTQAQRGAPPSRLVDVGTGAGFPGLVLKILYPQVQLTLVESVGKKLEFCRHVAEDLGLEGITYLHQRAEEVGQLPEHRELYDWAVARAVANLPVLAEYLLPLVRRGGIMLAMKGENAPAEAHAGDYAIHVLGGHLRRLIPITLPGVVEQRYLVVVDKVAATPAVYPRRVGIPTKRPLHADQQTSTT
ncbi:MAG: 16S rRNA (guanine(527)-N(7))-methyltransferase RsmG [Anaerolineales bacterium]